MNNTLRENIDWVGAVDWNIRDFHGYDTERGSSYNAYLIRDEKTALIDTVKAPFAGELLRNVAALCDLNEVEYVVCNHAEPDHAGALPEVLRAMPQATLVCDKKCADELGKYFDTSNWKIKTVADGETLSIGRRTLRFIETPMVHWPESMFTYVPEERLLFSMDAFGQHYASGVRFDDEADLAIIMQEAKTYYANIGMPYAKPILQCLDKLAGVEIDMIVPSHGLIWRSHLADILAAYRDWANYRCKPKVLVVYDTMWQSTDAMARAIIEGASLPGVNAMLMNVRRSNLTRIATESLDAAAVAVGSPTLNRRMMPMIAAMLCYLDGLRPTNKSAVAFGSYGWGRGGPEDINDALKQMKWDVLRDPIRSQWKPTAEVLDECRQIGRELAEKALTEAAS